jgi:hypothetical protein
LFDEANGPEEAKKDKENEAPKIIENVVNEFVGFFKGLQKL